MKLPIILVNKKWHAGFLIPEIMIAFSLMTLFLVSALTLSITMQKLHEQALAHLMHLEAAATALATTTLSSNILYGNDTHEFLLDPFTLLYSDYNNAWGRDSCHPRISFDPAKTQLFTQGFDLGSGNMSTDIEVRDGIAYLSADGSSASSPDFYILDVHDPVSPIVISSLNTGPGISALEVAGHYVYAANLSTTNQLQVIDISNRSLPILVAKYKLPLPQASTTPPLATTIFYSRGLIYLGTQKWDGNEFSVIDVTDPTSPHYIGGFESGTLVNNIYVRNGMAYVAASDLGQMRILDVSVPSSISEIGEFSPSGWATQEGKILSFFEDHLFLGRTTGGFNVVINHEIFSFSTTTQISSQYSHDIPGGVYGILSRPPNLFLATRSPGHEFQVWKSDLTQMIFDKSLGFLPQSMSCDGNIFYFATGTQKGIAVLKIN